MPEDLAELYARGGDHKHEATARLMQRVEAAVSTVTISAADYETLEFFWTLRRLTSNDQREQRDQRESDREREGLLDAPRSKKSSKEDLELQGEAGGSKLMSLERQVAFVRRFGRGYDRLLADGTPFKDSPRVQHVRSLCRDYNKHLKAMGLRDYQVCLPRLRLLRLCLLRLCLLRLRLLRLYSLTVAIRTMAVLYLLQVAFVLDELSRPRAVALLVSRALLLLLYAVCLVPAVLFVPLLVCTRSVAACKAAQAWCMVHGAWCRHGAGMVQAWCTVHSAWCMVAWCMPCGL